MGPQTPVQQDPAALKVKLRAPLDMKQLVALLGFAVVLGISLGTFVTAVAFWKFGARKRWTAVPYLEAKPDFDASQRVKGARAVASKGCEKEVAPPDIGEEI